MNKYKLSFKTSAEILKYIEEQEVQFIDLNFTDICGKWRHITRHAGNFTKELLDEGVAFDASSIAGWEEENIRGMILKPDISCVTYDPFAAQKTIKIFCDIFKPLERTQYECDPRKIAKAAESYLKKTSLGDKAYFQPKIEFFIFDNVQINIKNNHISYKLDGEEGSYNKGREYQTGNMGHRPQTSGDYLPEAPVDSLSDLRAEMLSVIESMGVEVEGHHHELSPSQCELGIKISPLLQSADNVQIYKHAVRNVAHSYGKSATFMPKPINGENGSAMHLYQLISKSGKSVFAGKNYANLSENALYYIGGILKHACSLSAFTNPSTNSYKRLASRKTAPFLLTYSSINKSAACHIAFSKSPREHGIEVRFPDPLANPYLAFSALIMAGLDGIENKIHPGEAIDKSLEDFSMEEALKVPMLCSSLDEALQALREDHSYLLKGDVFTPNIIEAFINIKVKEIELLNSTTHPVEANMYYSG